MHRSPRDQRRCRQFICPRTLCAKGRSPGAWGFDPIPCSRPPSARLEVGSVRDPVTSLADFSSRDDQTLDGRVYTGPLRPEGKSLPLVAKRGTRTQPLNCPGIVKERSSGLMLSMSLDHGWTPHHLAIVDASSSASSQPGVVDDDLRRSVSAILAQAGQGSPMRFGPRVALVSSRSLQFEIGSVRVRQAGQSGPWFLDTTA